MKKIISLMLSLSLLTALCACADAGTSQPAPSAVTAQVDITPAPANATAAPVISSTPSAVPSEAPAVPSESPAPNADAPQEKSDAAIAAEKYISVYREKKGEYRDSVGNFYKYDYVIPMFNLGGAGVSKLNEEIADTFDPFVDDSLANMKDGFSLNILAIKYEAYLNGDILSLVVSVDYDTDYTMIYVRNLDVSAKEAVDGDYLFSRTDMGNDGTGLSDVTAASVGKFYDENYPDRTTKPWLEMFELTMEKDNLAQTQYYFDGDGTLTGIVRMYFPAGAGLYYVPVPIER